MLKSVAGRQVQFNPLRLPSLPVRSRRIGLRTMPSIGAKKAAVCPFEFTDGWETGDFSKWSAPTPLRWEIITNPVHHGSYAIGAVDGTYELEHAISGYPPDYYVRLFFRLSGTLPTSYGSAYLIHFLQFCELVLMVETGMTPTPRFALWNLVTDAYAGGGTKIEADTWYCLVLKAQANNSLAAHKLWVNGVEDISLSDNTSGSQIESVLLCGRKWGAPYTGKFIVDCFIADRTEQPTCDYYSACLV